MDPSGENTSHQEQFFEFLENINIRKLYNKILDCGRKKANKIANVVFLTKCLEHKVIPNTFMITNQPHGSNQKYFAKWTSAAKCASLSWIRITITEEENLITNISYQYKEMLRQFGMLIPDHLHGHSVDIFKAKHDLTLISFEKSKLRKFEHLFQKSNSVDTQQRDENKKNKRKFIKKRVWTRRQRKFRNKGVCLYFNYSTIQITKDMDKLLNRGLNFSPSPGKVNITELLIDIDKFIRSHLWKEFFYLNQPPNRKQPIVKNVKTNLPKNHRTPENLKRFLNATTSELLDEKNRNPVIKNLSAEETEALKQLTDLQKNRIITIKPADKGAGIVILNFEDYIKSCNDHLTSKQNQPDGTYSNYYEKIGEDSLTQAKEKITNLIEEGFDNRYISKEEFEALDPSDKGASRFYQIFKVHKNHSFGTIPPSRPIISGNNSITENMSRYINHHIKSLVNKIPSYLQDTPDFLRHLENENKIAPPLENEILVTIDVSSLYTNISPEEGIAEVRNSMLNCENRDSDIPVEFLMRVLEQVLTLNIFELDKQLYIQKIGTAMGTVCAPPYANIFMNKIDNLIKNLAKSIGHVDPIRLYKRFLDDIFLVWKGSIEELQNFLSQLNSLHPTIKFTSEITSPYKCDMKGPHDCFCHSSKSIPFLDTKVSIDEGKFVTDLYRKPTDRCQYLLPSSCHPSHITKNIPFNLCNRLLRICSDRETLKLRLEELKCLLLSREYRKKSIEDSIQRVLNMDRNEALKYKPKQQNDRTIFVLTYNPALPSVSKILQKHWRVMVGDPYLKEVFPRPPMVAFRRAKNLKDHLIRAKIPPPPPVRLRRILNGMTACNKPLCGTCPYVKKTTIFKGPFSKNQVTLNHPMNCLSKNVVYCIQCTKCQQIYIGQTSRALKDRFGEHKTSVRTLQKNTIGDHFNGPGHSVAHMTICAIEKVFNSNCQILEKRENMWIKNFEAEFKGLNRKK